MSFLNFASSVSGTQTGTAKAILKIRKKKSASTSNKSIIEDTSKKLMSSSGAGAGATTGGAADSEYQMVVQYNPSSLSIQANAESIPTMGLQQHIDNSIPNQSSRPPMVVLAVELIFEDINPADAFMLDKLRLSTGSLISDTAGIVTAAKGRAYTVQPQTNALLATMLRSDTKEVEFVWGDMSFRGEVIEAEASYTMFSPSGRPIRSSVQLNISQKITSNADDTYWDKVIEQGVKESGKSKIDKIGNILNLNMF